jgi:hypothetical protein
LGVVVAVAIAGVTATVASSSKTGTLTTTLAPPAASLVDDRHAFFPGAVASTT